MTDYEEMWDFYEQEFGVDFIERDITEALYIYFSPFLLLVGTFGNILSLIILAKLSRKVWSTCLYLTVLTVTDLIVLYARCGNDWLRKLTHIDLSNMLMVYSESICKVYPFLFNFVIHLSRWLIVCMTIESTIAFKQPQNLMKWCSMERGRAVMLLLTVLLVCINIHYFWSYELLPLNEMQLPPGLWCTFTRHGHQHSEEFLNIWPILDVAIAEVLPSITVFVCIVIMSIQIGRKRHRGDKWWQEWQAKYTLDPQAIEHLKITFLVIGILSILMTLPKFAVVIFKYLLETHPNVVEFTFELDAKANLAQAVCSSLEYIFLSAKFFIYVAISRRFREELKHLWCCPKKLKDTAILPNVPSRRRYVNNIQDTANERLVNEVSVSPPVQRHNFSNRVSDRADTANQPDFLTTV